MATRSANLPIESRYPALRRADPRARLQAALVALDPATGEIRAFVGGRDYETSQFNRVTLARRQAGRDGPIRELSTAAFRRPGGTQQLLFE